jgi:hypothetical protein
MIQWVIYRRPRDYPDSYVARRWFIEKGKVTPTPLVLLCPEILPIREHLSQLGLVRLSRFEQDDPTIVEVWT